MVVKEFFLFLRGEIDGINTNMWSNIQRLFLIKGKLNRLDEMSTALLAMS
jgi:hypothetical protein